MTEWIAALADLAEAGRPCVLVTVLRADGSTPRPAGTKMVVAEEGFRGSIGGGHLEQKALEIARELLAAPGAEAAPPVVRDFALGPSLGQCCGGSTTLVFETIAPVRWDVAVFGAGHVGKALVKLLADLPCRVTWIDSREAEFPQALPPRVRRVVPDAPEDAVADLPAGCDVVVMTHSHQLDQQVVEAAMRRGQCGYLGLIGSETKRARCIARLESRGFSPDDIARLTCPIGIAGVGGKLPAEIAIAVAAQLLQIRGVRVQTR
jgi:xanthine dehydrogenase accessory factor